MIRIYNLRLCYSVVKSCSSNCIKIHNLKPVLFHQGNLIERKHFSLQAKIESLARTQTGIFKTLSESAPVEYIQNFLVTFHDASGIPWWGTIVCTTVLLRTFVTLPLTVYQYYIMAKLENLKLEMPAIVNELKRETAMAIKLFKWDEKKTKMMFNRSVRKQWKNLILRDNCHPFKATLVVWFQIPMWISLSVALRNLVYMLPNNDFKAQLIFKELSVGGFGFIPNLTEVDSSLFLPLTLGITSLAIIELQNLSRTDPSTKYQKFLINFFRGLSVIIIPIAASVPSCLVLYWTTSSTYGLIQNILMASPKFKRACRIPKTATELENPYRHVLNEIKKRYNFIYKLH